MQVDNSVSGSVLSDINITPFVDVMLVLLVIFIVAAPLIQSGVAIDLPQTDAQSILETESSDIILSINGKREIYINRNKVALSTLEKKLEAIYKGKKKKVIYLKADKNLPYGYVIKVMALLKNAGIDELGMITESEMQRQKL